VEAPLPAEVLPVEVLAVEVLPEAVLEEADVVVCLCPAVCPDAEPEAFLRLILIVFSPSLLRLPLPV
jgi:hypothetical protein